MREYYKTLVWFWLIILAMCAMLMVVMYFKHVERMACMQVLEATAKEGVAE